MSAERSTVRIAAVGDLHCPRTSDEELRELFHRLAEDADVLLLCGDLTEFGRVEEARLWEEHLDALRPLPVLGRDTPHDRGTDPGDGHTVTLFSVLMSAFRPSARQANAFAPRESIPWDADTFPSHTVRRSIELAAMVPGRKGGRLEPATLAALERRSRRRRRRALLLLCAVGGLGLILLSLVQASRRHPSQPQEARRAQRESIRPAPGRPRREVIQRHREDRYAAHVDPRSVQGIGVARSRSCVTIVP